MSVTTRVKICGITSPEDGAMAARAGADAVGLVFWSRSPRRVSLAAAREIGRALPPFVLRVGVFVDAAPTELIAAAEAARLDVLQLHGDEPPEDFAGLPRRGIKALRVGPGFDVEQALRYEGRASGLLLDTRSGSAPGGTGETFDWSLAQGLRPRVSYLILAGGLTPENVGAAISQMKPDAVDVSSGVESAPGRKDPEKVRAFIEAVRRTT
jgi:phosphoribosylanthranilate isomerase